MKEFKFEVVTPERVFYEDKVEMIVFKIVDGEMGIMANHAPMLIANEICVLKITKNNERKYAFISEGIIEVTEEKVTAIVDLAEWPDEIDVEEAMKNKKLLEEKLRLDNDKQDLEMKAELVASIERAKNRIKTAEIMRM